VTAPLIQCTEEQLLPVIRFLWLEDVKTGVYWRLTFRYDDNGMRPTEAIPEQHEVTPKVLWLAKRLGNIRGACGRPLLNYELGHNFGKVGNAYQFWAIHCLLFDWIKMRKKPIRKALAQCTHSPHVTRNAPCCQSA